MKNKSVPGYKRVFAWMIAVFAMVIPWISYLRIWKLTDAQADVFENYNGYVFDFCLCQVKTKKIYFQEPSKTDSS